LKDLLTGLARHLFGDVEMRWREDYFPFTQPSFELEVLFNEKWLEVLGCGVIHHDVLNTAGKTKDAGWAFGLGLERLAMVLFDIPDIRLFWSNDDRFLKQFHEKDKNIKFKPFSKYPLCYKDMSFWLPEDQSFHPNDIYEVRIIYIYSFVYYLIIYAYAVNP
jgi:phenylalanyl-tRNA synthetase alpha chain